MSGSKIKYVKEQLEKKLEKNSLSSLWDKDTESIIAYAEDVAKDVVKNVEIKRTQLRKYFNEIKTLKHKLKGVSDNGELPSEVRARLIRLKPLLAYAVSPKRELISKDFYELMSFLIDKVKEGKKKDFKAFENFFEAIIAYHTYYEQQKDQQKDYKQRRANHGTA